jgi:aspartate/methionine/tyrosine aminotransferase
MKTDTLATDRDPIAFDRTPMVGLLDVPVRYDLAESTCPALRLDEIAGWDDIRGLSLDYGYVQGSPSLRSRIAEDHGADPQDVILTAGSAGAMRLIAQDRCHGRTLLLTPCYPPARVVPEGLGSAIDRVALRFDDGYRMPVDRIADALTPQTTLVSVASPQNPSGIRFQPGEFTDLLAAMADRSPDAVLLVDETYRASSYGDAPIPESVAAMSPRVVACSSVSKAHGAPGLRLGWLVVTDHALRDRLRNAKFAGEVASPSIDELLADRLLARRQVVLRPRAEFLAEQLAELVRWADGRPIELLRPDGGALCCLRLPAAQFGEAAVRAFYAELAERQTRVAPGSWFGEDDRVFRLGFGHLDAADFTQALARLGEALSHSRGR